MTNKYYQIMPIGETETGLNIAAAESHYDATFMGDFCLKTIGGGWSDSSVAIFWQSSPPVEGYSHYMGLFQRNGQVLITSGESAFSEPIIGIVADDGEVVYSRYRHDFRTSSDGSVSIDGGRDYCKCSGNINNKMVHIVPEGPTLKAISIPSKDAGDN